MGSSHPVPCRFFLLLAILLFFFFSSSHLRKTLAQLLPVEQEPDDAKGDGDLPRVYIVYVLPPQHKMFSSPEERETWHKSFLPTTTLDSGKPRMVYSYSKAISGFAALLTPREVDDIRQMEGFVDAEPDEPVKLETSHTPRYLGLVNGTGLWEDTQWGEGRIIGVIDSNIAHNHISFAGTGMQPPTQWKGTCDFKCKYPDTCTCTNKLLGARLFTQQPGEETSHGTMVASIAAGDFIAGAGYEKYAEGTASGVAPNAYLSFYSGVYTADVLAAIEQAIDDGVDILSISISNPNSAFHNNVWALGTLAAVERGVFVVMAAGNYGPNPKTVCNDAPWQMTVGSCTHDRALEVTMVLVVRQQLLRFYGVAQTDPDDVNPITLNRIVYPGDMVATCDNTLGGKYVARAIVLCKRDPLVSPIVQAETVKREGGIAMVLMNDAMTGNTFHLLAYLPIFTVAIGHQDSINIVGHIKSKAPVKACFYASNSRYGVQPYPLVSKDSGRGPSQVTNGILKPDILGPGVNILGAEALTTDKFRVGSGTSFATPHLSAVAAMLKSRHPSWSPAVIRSAIMTTANTMDSQQRSRISDYTGQEAEFYATGSGLVNPQKADDPGLVYDITDIADYVRVLCSLYTQAEVNKFATEGRNVDCSTLGKMEPEQLNYPSITVILKKCGKKKVYRRVTNVGEAMSVYDCSLEGVPPEVTVTIDPCRLTFTRMHEVASFMVAAELVGTLPSGQVINAYLRWTSAQTKHLVTSPLSLIIP